MKSWLFSLLSVLCVGSTLAQGKTVSPTADDLTPYRTSTAPVPVDERRKVRVFFSFACPYSAQSHMSLARWGDTLPAGMKIEMTPVVTKDPGTGYGAAYYYAVLQMMPKQLDSFTAAVYDEIQRKNARMDRHETYLAAARRVGISPDALRRAVQRDQVRDGVYSAAALLSSYKIDATPSVVSGGKYVVTPEATQGVNGNFYQLINAVTSKHLTEVGGIN